MIYFTSDTHFGHKNIIEYCGRPYSTVKEMNYALIRNWNRVVGDMDTVFHLGDLSFVNQDWTHSLLKELRGTIHLIKGNHDRKWTSDRIASIKDKYELRIGNQVYFLQHKPAKEWEGMHKGVIHLHGHNHGHPYHDGLKANRLDVGVDCHGYYPISLTEVNRIVERNNIKGAEAIKQTREWEARVGKANKESGKAKGEQTWESNATIGAQVEAGEVQAYEGGDWTPVEAQAPERSSLLLEAC